MRHFEWLSDFTCLSGWHSAVNGRAVQFDFMQDSVFHCVVLNKAHVLNLPLQLYAVLKHAAV